MKLPISPLVGEMSGRTEGGATDATVPESHSRIAAILPFAADRIQPPLVLYFLHNGCVSRSRCQVRRQSGTMAPSNQDARERDMIEYGHFIGGKRVAGTSGRKQDVMQPMDGTVRGTVALASQAELRAAVENAKAAQPAWAATNPQRRVRVLMKFLELAQPRIRLAGRHPGARARQDHRRRQGRHPARPRSGRGLHRRAAHDEGRIHRRRRPRHRRLFDAPAARRRRRHHPVQLPGDDPAVEDRAGDRLRQRLHPEAVGARSGRAAPDRRTVHRGRPAGRHPQRRQRRQGSGRRHPRRSRHQGRSASSARRRSRSTSIRAAARPASACSASAAPRTT